MNGKNTKISYNVVFNVNLEDIKINYDIDFNPKYKEIIYIDIKDKKMELYEKGNRRKTKRKTE